MNLDGLLLVHINQVGLAHFKSFGGSMTIPLEEGFTVVTGPNGSGKSNILDGVLFCLGLATSRGMRADRLPDLVNSGVLRDGKSAETVVSVRFDLTDWKPDIAEDGLEPPEEGPWIRPDQKEWTVTRRLRVMPGGSYSSSYSADGESCNLQQLQTQLRRLRIDPEGSNVVMQGDVTRIVSMSNRDRRGLIDELAGVALFDHRIEQARAKLNDVQARQEKCSIVEQELVVSRLRLEKDCAKARKYQELKDELQLGRKQELVLAFETAEKGLVDLNTKYEELGKKELRDTSNISEAEQKLSKAAIQLKTLQEEVKALGEDKLLAVQAELAGFETQSRELERQASSQQEEGENLQRLRQDLKNRRQELQANNENESEDSLSLALQNAEQICRNAEAAVEVSRRRLGDVAGRSGAWLEEQHNRNLRRHNLQASLTPLQQEEHKLQERLRQDLERQKELEADQQIAIEQNQTVHQQLDKLDKEWKGILQQISDQKDKINHMSESLQVQQKTRNRLEQEQVKLEKEIARLESRRETLQESRGTGALRLLLEAGLEGIHGPVAQLGEVNDKHRLALEVAAGGRLAHIVVENDRIAAKAIELLKIRKAGRLTFLPLNRITRLQANSLNKALQRARSLDSMEDKNGLIGKAFELITYEETYANVFAYVFGETLVYKDLNSARVQLGVSRAVTLDGELLEKSGAMTGGSFLRKNGGLSFGLTSDGDDAQPLRNRLLELGEALVASKKEEARLTDLLQEIGPVLRQFEQRQAALEAERSAAKRANGPLVEGRRERFEKIQSLQTIQKQHRERLDLINIELEPLLIELKELEQQENVLQTNEDKENWKKLQADLEAADEALGNARIERDHLLNDQRQRDLDRERLGDQRQALIVEEDRLKEAVKALAFAHEKRRDQQKELLEKQTGLEKEHQNLQSLFGEQRRARDETEADVAQQRQKLQEAQWKLERLREDRESVAEEIRSAKIRLKELAGNLPNPPPQISEEVRGNGLEALQIQLQQLQLKMETLEPVNMLALEELGELNKRLGELVEKLEVLSQEREELLLRIETVATLRQEAFMEAFEAVDGHFREIFASLSDGDGHLQLDNDEDPLEGGLTLVAHPKGKTVRRLAAMSGGEKSLTALSFLFALQRFRPSPFYALDEVDSFLDGVNVERLAALIARQAEQAQFLVVSHRRPMIGASSRTIGVTQARGAHTQVLGLPEAA